MVDDVLTAAGGASRRVRSEAEWQALMTGFERWDGSQASYCEVRGVSVKTFQCQRRAVSPWGRQPPGPWALSRSRLRTGRAGT